MHPPLPKIELGCYFLVVLVFFGWTSFEVYKLSHSKDYVEQNIESGYLQKKEEYFIPNSVKDVSNGSWRMWEWFLSFIAYYQVMHCIIMRLSAVINPKYRFHTSALFTTGFCLYFYGLKAFLYLLYPSLLCFSFAYFTQNSTLIWIMSLISIYLSHIPVDFIAQDLLRGERHFFYVYMTSHFTCSLRFIAFCLEYCWKAKEKESNASYGSKLSFTQSLTDLFLYQLYFPLFAAGPILTCDNFLKQIKKEPAYWSKSFLVHFVLNICRFWFWFIVATWIQHYFYFSSISRDLDLLKSVPLAAIYGLVLWQVQFFNLEYIIVYGFHSKIAAADNMDVPGGPPCWWTKPNMTLTWKYFDRGLHKWLVRYIFVPLNKSKKTQGMLRSSFVTMVVFGFVGFWHGMRVDFVLWAAFNGFGIIAGKILDNVLPMKPVQNSEKAHLSPAMIRRIRCVLYSPLNILLVLANCYFLAGFQVTNLWIKRFYKESVFGTISLHAAGYCITQCGVTFVRMRIGL